MPRSWPTLAKPTLANLLFLWFGQIFSPTNSKRAHFRARALQTHQNFHERTRPREEERKKIVAGEGKKREISCPPHLRGPTLRGPTLRAPPFGASTFSRFGPHPSWPPPLGVPHFGAPTLREAGSKGSPAPLPLWRDGWAKDENTNFFLGQSRFGQSRIGQSRSIRMAKIGLA